MSNDEHAAAAASQERGPAAYKPKPGDGWLTRRLHGFYVWRGNLEAHPLWGTLFAVTLAVAGFGASMLWQWYQEKTAEPDKLLVEIKEKQDEEFRALREGLDRLADGEEGAAREVRTAVKAIESTNSTLIEQLSLAREEYGRLQKVAGGGASVQGGYDVILTEETGIRIDAVNVLGVTDVQRGGARTTITSGTSEPIGEFLTSGESLPYKAADGRDCRASLLSISEAGKAASFALACSPG